MLIEHTAESKLKADQIQMLEEFKNWKGERKQMLNKLKEYSEQIELLRDTTKNQMHNQVDLAVKTSIFQEKLKEEKIISADWSIRRHLLAILKLLQIKINKRLDYLKGVAKITWQEIKR